MKSVNIDFAGLASQFRNLNPNDPGTWPLIPRLAVLMLILTAACVAGWFFYWSGLQDQLNLAREEEQRLKTDYKAKLQKAINLDVLLKQKEQVSTYVNALEKQLPSKSEMDALLSDVNTAGVGRGLQFELFRPGAVTAKDYYAELPIDLKVTGSYHDIGSFASDIANLPRIVTLNNLQILDDKSGARLSMHAIAKTFRYLDEQEIEAQRKVKVDVAKKAGGK